ncbi:hypothetical protein LINGRAHAP2_LOCUS27952 [Linum grandiflorum]
MVARSAIPSCIRTDCLTLVDGLRKGPGHWPWQCSAWLQRMDTTLRINPQLRVSFTPRRHNIMADRIAKAAANGTLPNDWLQCAYFTNPDCKFSFLPP